MQFDEISAPVESTDDHDTEPDVEMSDSPKGAHADMTDVQVDSDPVEPRVESPAQSVQPSTQDPEPDSTVRRSSRQTRPAGEWWKAAIALISAEAFMKSRG